MTSFLQKLAAAKRVNLAKASQEDLAERFETLLKEVEDEWGRLEAENTQLARNLAAAQSETDLIRARMVEEMAGRIELELRAEKTAAKARTTPPQGGLMRSTMPPVDLIGGFTGADTAASYAAAAEAGPTVQSITTEDMFAAFAEDFHKAQDAMQDIGLSDVEIELKGNAGHDGQRMQMSFNPDQPPSEATVSTVKFKLAPKKKMKIID